MLIMPAITSGAIDVIPVFSSILSMMKIAMMDVNAIVIYVQKSYDINFTAISQLKKSQTIC